MFSLCSYKETKRIATGQTKHLSNKQELAWGASEWDTSHLHTLAQWTYSMEKFLFLMV